METEKLSLSDQGDEEKMITQVVKALKSIRYGHVQITVQDAKVVQIEKVEKFRINHNFIPILIPDGNNPFVVSNLIRCKS